MLKERKPNRMAGFDYGRDALYFVTSCVQDRVCCFGAVSAGKMMRNRYGDIAHEQWEWLQTQYPYIVSHEFIVMPNHIHGVLEINRDHVGTGRDLSVPEINRDHVGTGRDLSVPEIKIKSLSELMGAYKTTTSKKIHLSGYPEFQWQRSFHDHIIRDEKSYHNIVHYIRENASKWKGDKFYSIVL
mgnify:CR=1 FL=1